MDVEGLRLSLIVAMTPERVIGKDGAMPWELPSDLRRFRLITEELGTVIMGRRTYDSILDRLGHPLLNRFSIVLSNRAPFRFEGGLSVRSVDEALVVARDQGPQAAVIGGATVYETLLPRCDEMHVTTVHANIAGDTVFPHPGEMAWECVDETPIIKHAGDEHPTAYKRFIRG